MARKPPKLDHVKHVLRRGRWYSYFNTGQKVDGKPVYKRMPDFTCASFFSSYAALKAGRTKRGSQTYTLADLCHDYRQSSDFADKADNTRKLYANQLKRIAATWGKFPVNELQPQYVQQALDREEWGAGTRQALLGVLGAVYTWGRKRGKASVWPSKDVERPKGGEHQPWPDDVVEAALKSDDPVVRLSVHLLFFTGQRIGDVLKMRWGDIRDGYIFVRQTKTGKIVEPPLIADLKAELDRTPKTAALIMPDVTYRVLRKRLQDFTKAHGAETVPHGLRKNAVNVLLEAGSTIAEVSSITGQTFQVVEKYAAKVNRRKLGNAAIVKLAEYRKKSA